jgi:hypothetical protein
MGYNKGEHLLLTKGWQRKVVEGLGKISTIMINIESINKGMKFFQKEVMKKRKEKSLSCFECIFS